MKSIQNSLHLCEQASKSLGSFIFNKYKADPWGFDIAEFIVPYVRILHGRDLFVQFVPRSLHLCEHGSKSPGSIFFKKENADPWGFEPQFEAPEAPVISRLHYGSIKCPEVRPSPGRSMGPSGGLISS